MTMEDLRDHGVLLPEEEWGKHRLETTTSPALILVLYLAAAGAAALIWVGEGRLLTWIGLVAFLVVLYVLTFVLDRAVMKQRRRFRRERREAAGDGSEGGEEQQD